MATKTASLFERERSVAQIGVRLLMPSIHLGNVVDRNRESWEALQRGEEYRPFEELADWWPTFVHRFRPAEKVWQLDGSTILGRDSQAQHMFGDILTARDYLAERIDEVTRSTTANAPLYPELFGPTTALDVLMMEFYRVAAATANVGRMKWWRGSVWAQERKAWTRGEAAWYADGPQSPGGGWNSGG